MIVSNKKRNEMEIFLKVRELISFSYNVTENWPKKYRFDLINRVKDISLEVYENLIDANEVFIDAKYLNEIKSSIDKLSKQVVDNQGASQIYFLNNLLALQVTKANKVNELISKRRENQNQAFSNLKKLEFLFNEAYSRHLINLSKWEKVSNIINDIIKLLKAWIASDKKRFQI